MLREQFAFDAGRESSPSLIAAALGDTRLR
jgi:hypothetical protein